MNTDKNYDIWRERSSIADCFRKLGLNSLADKAMDFKTSNEQIDHFLNIIKQESMISRNHDVIECLFNASVKA